MNDDSVFHRIGNEAKQLLSQRLRCISTIIHKTISTSISVANGHSLTYCCRMTYGDIESLLNSSWMLGKGLQTVNFDATAVLSHAISVM